jgi:hypothetical protein
MAEENHGERPGQDGRAQDAAKPDRRLNRSPHGPTLPNPGKAASGGQSFRQ